jgi:HlyD family secretion protein
MKRIIVGVLLVIAVGVGARAYYNSREATLPTISTGRVSQGSIVDAVAATGTLQAVTTVLVGTQVSGTLTWLGADFNSIVHKGQVIARLDPSLINAQIQQAQAGMAKAAADVDNTRVQVADAQQKYTRAQSLASKSLIAQSDLDTAKVAVDSAQAQLKSSQAQLVQAQASLDQNQVDLQHTVIAAPIDGMVIQRSVDVGQTVAASLSSPTLFSIAADLTKMQVQMNIDESDIGRVLPGQRVTFSVDAYPGDTFTGTTTQVRLQPAVVQNVTTYTVIVDVPNPELKLKPGMTATVSVEIARRDDVMRVPNAALRFTPTATTITALGLDPSALTNVHTKSDSATGRIWVRENSTVRPIAVQLGLSDGQTTEVVSSDVAPGSEVVTSVSDGSARAATTASSAGGMFMQPGGRPAGGRIASGR